MSDKILITGSRGFIGSHLRKALSDFSIVEFDLQENPKHDVTNANVVRSFWKQHKPKIVIHLAANANPALAWTYPAGDARTNVIGTINVLDASLLVKVELLIFTSTAHVYDVRQGHLPISEIHPCFPRSPYAISKYCAELYCQHYMARGLNIVIFRLFNVYGPGQSRGYVIPDVLTKINMTKTGQPVNVLGPPDDSRDFVYVEDVVRALLLALKIRPVNEIINIGSGKETEILTLYQTAASVLGKRVNFKFEERPVGRLGSRFQADIRKAQKTLNWEPLIDLEEGLKRTALSLNYLSP